MNSRSPHPSQAFRRAVSDPTPSPTSRSLQQVSSPSRYRRKRDWGTSRFRTCRVRWRPVRPPRPRDSIDAEVRYRQREVRAQPADESAAWSQWVPSALVGKAPPLGLTIHFSPQLKVTSVVFFSGPPGTRLSKIVRCRVPLPAFSIVIRAFVSPLTGFGQVIARLTVSRCVFRRRAPVRPWRRYRSRCSDQS
jgi:hypothetical protein